MSEVIDTIPQSKLRNPLFNAIWSLDSSGNPVGLVGPGGEVLTVVRAETDNLTGGINLIANTKLIKNTTKNRYDFFGRTITQLPTILQANLKTPSAWTPTNCSIDPSSQAAYKRNSQGALKVTPTTASAIIVNTAGYASAPFDLSAGGCVGIWVYIDSKTDQNVASNAYINIVLGNNYSRSNAKWFGFAGNHIKSNQWTYLVAHTSETGAYNAAGTGTTGWGAYGTGTFASPITQIEFDFGNLSGKDIYIDSVEFGLRSRPTIILGFDGISSASNAALMPLLEERNIKVTMAYNSSVSGIPTNPTIYEDQLAYGHELVNHGDAHYALGTATQNSVVDAEVLGGAEDMRALGLMRDDAEDLFIFPQNATCPFTNTRMEQLGFVSARGYKGISIMDTPYGLDNPLNIGSFDIGNPTSLSRILDIMDMPAVYGATLFIFAHDINTTTGVSGPTGNAQTIYIDDLIAVLDKYKALRDAGTVDALTYSQWVDRLGYLR